MRTPGDKMPYVQQWNVAVERQIGKDASLTVAYAGSRGTTPSFAGVGYRFEFQPESAARSIFFHGTGRLVGAGSKSVFWTHHHSGTSFRTNHWPRDSFCCPSRNTSECYSWILTEVPQITSRYRHHS